MATAKSDTTPYWSTSTTFPQFAKLGDDAEADVVVVGGGIGVNARYGGRFRLLQGIVNYWPLERLLAWLSDPSSECRR